MDITCSITVCYPSIKVNLRRCLTHFSKLLASLFLTFYSCPCTESIRRHFLELRQKLRKWTIRRKTSHMTYSAIIYKILRTRATACDLDGNKIEIKLKRCFHLISVVLVKLFILYRHLVPLLIRYISLI